VSQGEVWTGGAIARAGRPVWRCVGLPILGGTGGFLRLDWRCLKGVSATLENLNLVHSLGATLVRWMWIDSDGHEIGMLH
jgi:hypothetical protein